MDDKRTILDSKDQPSLKDFEEDINFESKEGEDQIVDSGIIQEEDIIDLDEISNIEGLIKHSEENNQNHISLEDEKNKGINLYLDVKSNLVVSDNTEAKDGIEKVDKTELDKFKLKYTDLNSISREEAIDLLMGSKLEVKRKPKKSSKKNNKYDNVKSHFESDKLNQNSYHRPNDLSDKDPETTYDFNTACTKFLANLLKGSKQNYSKLIKLMIYNSKIEEIKKLETSEPAIHYSKINMYLQKKQNILESIQKKLNKEFYSKHTFSPQTNVNRTQENYDFKLFLYNQNKFQQKVSDKLCLLKLENEKKGEIQGHPIISQNTNRILNEKAKLNNDPVFLRLYNKRNEEKKIMKKKEVNETSTKKLDRSTIEELINRLYKETFNTPEIKKELEIEYQKLKIKDKFSLNSSNKIILKKFIKQYKSVLSELENIPLSSNKSLDNNKIGDLVSNSTNGNVTTANITTNLLPLSSSENLSEQSNNIGSYIINSSSKPENVNKNEKKNLKLNLYELNTLLTKLNFTSKEKENSPNTTIVNFNESSLKQKEKKLVNELFDNLKDSEGFINKDQLFIFLLSVLNLYEFYLFKMNIDKFNTKDIIKELEEKELANNKVRSKSNSKPIILIKSKSNTESNALEKHTPEKEEKVCKYVIEKINSEIISKLKITKKYYGYDEKGLFYITVQMSKTINKDFNLFTINWLESLKNISKGDSQPSSSPNKNMTFRPNVNEKSKKLSLNFRRKIQSEVESHIGRFFADRNSINLESDKFNLNYVKLLLIKKQKDEKQLAKKKEEIESKELKQCTFKPKINSNYETTNTFNQVDTNRIESLYKAGVTKNVGRKDRPKEEFELEKFGKNCSFRPNIKKLPDFKNTDYFDVDFSEKEYVNKFNRLEKGRIEKKIRDTVHTREPFSSRIDIKEIKKIAFDNSVPPIKDTEKTITTSLKSISQNNLKEFIKKNKTPDSGRSKSVDEELNNSVTKSEKTVIKNKLEEKKDLIPLLIIDVNIRPGDKKKIYVFDGDTAEGLSDKFSKENGLDNETKIKLKVLIQNHMSKLLMRIEEENHSLISESSTKQFIF